VGLFSMSWRLWESVPTAVEPGSKASVVDHKGLAQSAKRDAVCSSDDRMSGAFLGQAWHYQLVRGLWFSRGKIV